MNEQADDIIENLNMVSPPDPYFWLWVALAAFVVLVIAGGVGFQLYRKKRLPFFQEKPPIPPHVTALEKLAAIRGLIEEGRHREFTLEVSKVLRYYIEERFELKAPHVSTEEFLFLAERSDRLDPAHRTRLEEFLTQCDRVKFALAHMEVPHMTMLYETAESFINETRQEPQSEAPAGEGAAA